MTTDLESSLRDAFRHGADELPHTVDPWTRTTTAVRRSQVRRRTTALAVAASALVVGVGVVTVGVPSLRADQGRVARPSQDADVAVTTDDLTTWPLRGGLRGDTAFVAAATQALGQDGSVVRLLYAGPVGDHRVGVGLVDRRQDDGTTLQVVEAAIEPQPGAVPVDWLTPDSPGPTVDGQVSLGIQDEDGAVDLLVLARTDASYVAYSRTAVYDDLGRPSRSYTKVPAPGGVAAAHLDRGPFTTTSVLVGRDGEAGRPHELKLWWTALETPAPDPAIFRAVVRDPRCGAALDAADVQNATANVWGNRDPLRAPASVRPVWCRAVRGGAVGLFVVTLADGTTFQADMLKEVTSNGGGWMTGVGRPVPRGAGLTAPAVLGDIPRDGAAIGTRFFVNAPGAARVEVLVGTGSASRVVARATPDGDGFAEVRLSAADGADVSAEGSGGRVVLLDAAGRSTAELPLRFLEPNQDLDWDVTGPVS